MIGFAVCYIKHQKKYLLKQETVQFLCSSEDCEEWSKKIQEAIDQGTCSNELAFDRGFINRKMSIFYLFILFLKMMK